MAPKNQQDGSQLAALQESTDKILELLQGKLGEKGMVHQLKDVHDTMLLHKSEIDTAKAERADIRKDVSGLKKDRIRIVTIVSTLGVLGSEGLKKLATLFGGHSGQ